MGLSVVPLLGLVFIIVFNPSPQDSNSANVSSPRGAATQVAQSGSSAAQSKPASPTVLLGEHTLNEEKEYRAIFEYITKTYKNVETRDAEKISKYLVAYGKEHNIDPKFAAAVIARESGFNRKAISSTGAKGLGQIKDFNFKSLEINDPYDIKQNISGTTNYLKRMVGRWKETSESTHLALASYYKGPNAIKRAGGKYDSKTAGYVNDILKNYDEIKSVRARY